MGFFYVYSDSKTLLNSLSFYFFGSCYFITLVKKHTMQIAAPIKSAYATHKNDFFGSYFANALI